MKLAAELRQLKDKEAILRCGGTTTRWTPRPDGTAETLDEVDFLRRLKQRLQECEPGSPSTLSSPQRAVQESRQLLEAHAGMVLDILSIKHTISTPQGPQAAAAPRSFRLPPSEVRGE